MIPNPKSTLAAMTGGPNPSLGGDLADLTNISDEDLADMKGPLVVAQPCPIQEPHGYVIKDAEPDAPNRWRTMDSLGIPTWTGDRSKALCVSLREHAETFALDDDTEVEIQRTPLLEIYQAAEHEMTLRKDAAYLERNQVVAALAKCFPSGTAKTAFEGWSEDWHGCVYINLPTGQVSWHYHDSHAYLFKDLPPYPGTWDGHTTPEKYERLAALQPTDSSSREVWAGAATRGLVRLAMNQAAGMLNDDAFAARFHDVEEYRAAMANEIRGFGAPAQVQDVETPA